jgi:hypothetical protein
MAKKPVVAIETACTLLYAVSVRWRRPLTGTFAAPSLQLVAPDERA